MLLLPGLLQDLAAGYMSGKLLLKLDAIAFLLTHHTSGENCLGVYTRVCRKAKRGCKRCFVRETSDGNARPCAPCPTVCCGR